MADANGQAGSGAQGQGAQGDQGTPKSFIEQLPENLRTEPVFKNVKDLPDLAVQFVNAQRLIGVEKMPRPKDTWTDKEWNEFFAVAGRPETAEGYKLDMKSFKDIGLEDEVKKIVPLAHKAGMSQKQLSDLLTGYHGVVSDQIKAVAERNSLAKTEAEASLKKEFGSMYQANIEIAQSTLKKLASEDMMKKLDSSGFGNDPDFVRMLVKVGKGMMEDHASSGGGQPLNLSEATAAAMKIKELIGDQAFQKRLGNKYEIGHKEAVAMWAQLHSMAYPGKSDERE